MKPTAWMPMFWGDYLRDTSHLTMAEHGAYLLLIARYWTSGRALPDDDAQLSKIVHAQGAVWKRIRPRISAFFQVENGRWYHARIERELTAAYDRKGAAIKRGKHGAAVRWRNGASIDQAENKHSYHNHHHINHESESESLTDAARAKPETNQERLVRLANQHRQQTLKGKT